MPATPPAIYPGNWTDLNNYLAQVPDLNAQAVGLKAWTWNLIAGPGGGATAPSTQVIYATAMFLGQGTVINNVWLHATTASGGTVPTGMFLGICDATTMRAQSANVAAALAITLGPNSYALNAPFTVPTSGLYYGVLLVNGVWGTPPAVTRGFSAATVGQMPSAAFLWSHIGTGQTALPANAAAVTHAAENTGFWFGVS